MKTAYQTYQDILAEQNYFKSEAYFLSCEMLMSTEILDSIHADFFGKTDEEILEIYSKEHLLKFGKEFICN
ncbi:MAG: hypothetical protein IMZ64_05185 [Bacteroidetes bacterium]|nr:hypothetical protein [Bacteroidota bacterium]